MAQSVTKTLSRPMIVSDERRAVWLRAAGAWKSRSQARIRELRASRRQWAQRVKH